TLPMPRYADAAPHLTGSGEGKTVLLSDAVKMVLGKHMPAQQQPRGTCVSRGWSRAVDYLQCVQIALGHLPQEYQYISHAAVYGMAKEIGGDLAVQWGARGVPQKIKDLAKDNLVKTVTLVTTPEQARDMLCNGYPVSC